MASEALAGGGLGSLGSARTGEACAEGAFSSEALAWAEGALSPKEVPRPAWAASDSVAPQKKTEEMNTGKMKLTRRILFSGTVRVP